MQAGNGLVSRNEEDGHGMEERSAGILKTHKNDQSTNPYKFRGIKGKR